MIEKNIFIIGLNDFHQQMFEQLEHAEKCKFHGLLTEKEVLDKTLSPIELYERAKKQLSYFKGKIDGIIGYADFPVSTMVPLLNDAFGLPFTSLESYLQCDHKYWSRLSQKDSIPDYIPKFSGFDPFDDTSFDALDIAYPFWIKPVRSVSSHLGFKIESREDFERAKPLIRKHIDDMACPFSSFLDYVSFQFPDSIRNLPNHYFVAEELMGGHQCSMEASMQNGKLHVYGFVDTIRYPNSSTILSFQYPSKIPEPVQEEMARIGEKFLQHIQFDNIAFHIEFFWNEANNTIRLIEVNTRMCERHSNLFQKVAGVANHQAPLNLILGYPPVLKPQVQTCHIAAVLFHHVKEDGLVEAIPSPEDIAKIEAVIPGSKFELFITKGKCLSDLAKHDSYMYRLWCVYLGAENEAELKEKYQICVKLMSEKFKFS